jgi:hypothetical protein
VEYSHRYLTPMTRSENYVGTWGSDLVYNQALAGLGQRVLAWTWTWLPDDCTLQQRANPASPALVRGCVLGVGLLLLLGAVWACGRPFRRLPPDGPEQIGEQALEAGMVLALMLVLSPMSSKAHFGTLLLPAFCLARATIGSRDPLRWALLVAVVVLGPLGSKGLLGNRLYTLTLFYGATTIQTVLLGAGCGLVLRQQRARAQQVPCPAPAEPALAA